MATFPLKILTPDGVAYDGPAVSVSCRTINGQVQLLAKHIDFCTALGMGEAHIKLEDGTTRRAACMGGMLSMLKGECRLLATTFEWADAIDAERPRERKQDRRHGDHGGRLGGVHPAGRPRSAGPGHGGGRVPAGHGLSAHHFRRHDLLLPV